MSLPESHTKETLSAAYVSAVIARAEQSLNVTYQSDYGIDGIVHEIEQDAVTGSYDPTGPMFNFQLKATVRCRLKNGIVSYKMEPKAYNKFVKWDSFLPMVLIVYHMPTDALDWSNLTAERLQLKHCAYWRFMDVDQPVQSKKVVKIPQTNIFDEKAVVHILNIARRAKRENLDFSRL